VVEFFPRRIALLAEPRDEDLIDLNPFSVADGLGACANVSQHVSD
jgi:hypothetical protein